MQRAVVVVVTIKDTRHKVVVSTEEKLSLQL